jgi:gas vesicle protein
MIINGEKTKREWITPSRTLTLQDIPDTVKRKKTGGKENIMSDNGKTIAGAFLLGGLIGAGLALLYAPKSGRETRKDISKAARRVKRDAVELVEDTIQNVDEFVGTVKDQASDIIERGVELSDSAKKEVIKSLEYGQKIIEKQKRRIMEGLGL